MFLWLAGTAQSPHSAGGPGTSEALQQYSTTSAGCSVSYFIGACEQHWEGAAAFNAAVANYALSSVALLQSLMNRRSKQ